MVRRRTWLRNAQVETNRLNANDPSMIELIKHANIKPKGRWVDGDTESPRVASRAGVQKNTKRYIEPSKMQDAIPSVKMRLSVKSIELTRDVPRAKMVN
jgi:hypothetical protein